MPSPTQTCPQCGMRILPGALACINCNTPVPAPAATQPGYQQPGYPPPGYAAPPGYPPQPGYAPPPGYPTAPYYPIQAYGPAPWTTNGLTIASLILSLLWLGGLGSLLGIIFGHVSRGQIKRRPQRGEGLALAGLIIGYLGLIGAVVFWASLPRIINSGTVQDVLVQQDIHGAASAEHDIFNDTGSYTNDSGELRAKGFNPLGHDTILAAYGANDFCIVGAHNGTSKWYVDDSADGFSDFDYPTADEAEKACAVSNLGAFTTIN